jgi:hypothetical protein
MSFGGLADLGLKLVGGAGAHPVESPGAFIIEELSGQRRKVILIGRGLPYRPLELTGVQRVTTTWLPGFAEATATVMGAKDEPTVINEHRIDGPFDLKHDDSGRGCLSLDGRQGDNK